MRNRSGLLVSAIAFSIIAQPTQAQISPDGTTATQVNGNAIVPKDGGTISGGNLYHSFSDFNVPQSGVIFKSNSTVNGAEVQNIINRVTGGNPSAVLGTIESRQAFPNANLYLINPNGIVFGQNARLDIGGSFHASTGTGLGFDSGTFKVDKNSLSFPSGDPKSIKFAVTQPAGIINQGNLSVDIGKSITFTGGSIINGGNLTAPRGNIALTAVAGNSQVELRSPDAVLGLQVTAQAVPTDWNGKITELPQLAEMLTGKVPQANRVVVKADGSLALVANPAPTDITVTDGMAIASGRLDVSSANKGGTVGIFADKVGLVNAQIDASGLFGGGTVLIGGDLQGKGIAPNALKTFISNDSQINVSAILRGDGGKAIVWADRSTTFLGAIIAKGGSLAGNGGFVEVSGKQNLDYRGTVNTLAPKGHIGTLLLDPTDINIILFSSLTPASYSALTDVDQFSDPDNSPNTIFVNLINGATSDVILQATNDINFKAAVSTSVGLTAQAGRNINFTDGISTNGKALNLIAGGDINGSGTFANLSSTNLMGDAGAIALKAGGNITVNSIQAASVSLGSGSNVTLVAGGNIQTTGTTLFSGNIYSIVTDASTTGHAGNISLTSTNGAIDVSSGGVDAVAISGNSGNITLQSSGNIITQEMLASGNLAAGGNISLTSSNGAIVTVSGSIDTSSILGNAGNINLNAKNSITTMTLNSSSNFATGGNITLQSSGNITTEEMLASGRVGGGNISLTSSNGAIVTIAVDSGDINTSSIQGNAGNINLTAKNNITTITLNASSDLATGGNITLDPTGDIVFNSANTAGSIQGGNFSAYSSNGNIRVTGFVSSTFAACAGASICSASNSGGTGGSIFLRHGGLSPFVIGDSSTNGTAGIVTSGSSTLSLGKIIPVGTSIFSQGNITVAPSGNSIFLPPKILDGILHIDVDTLALIEIRDIMKKEVDRYLRQEDLPKAFAAIEKAYVSELGIFLGEDLKPPTLDINQAQDILSDVSKRSGSISALIYPILLNDRIEILVIPPKELGKPFHRYTNYVSEQEILTVLADYRDNLRDPDSLDFLVQSKQIYDWVMRPIDDRLQALKVETVVFVMDSGLRVIPPAALYDGKKFLLERYASANIPALRVTRLEERDRNNTRVLAMGLTEERDGLSALPTVEVEIRTVATEVLKGATFLNRDFTIANLQEQRGKADYGILHLGTHGHFLADRAQDSYIQFWDSKLRSYQIPPLRFDKPAIEMLTLSACETAVGNNLGISGLAVESGARSILASLWAVSDVGTAPLMISFYKAFPNAISKATALRQAQLDLLKGKVRIENNRIVGVEGLAPITLPKGTWHVDLRHPFFWSSFILVGNWL
ncbi:CHAT domain-containing protein [Pseudanabaena sp. UWO310]|uniref:CHAT domain-containing protein n=1 Tax=Pseudanabaena sp. UWO310 TaxID=2480795 RepID=UPI00115AB5F3|nr:CHAT domain-containing protein [Pseudanabaena sp. UWO310]TYQ30941.1 CHAT domain-containing protein [Pseudanabaena sp. UWO310]